MKIISFKEYLLEKLNQIPQLQILQKNSTHLTGKKEWWEIEYWTTLYDKYVHLVLITEDEKPLENPKIGTNRRYNTLDYNIPVLNFTSGVKLKNIIPKFKQFYNKPEAVEDIRAKSAFSKMYANEDFVCKTVTDFKEIDKLTYPVIAKPDRGLGGKGMQVFKTLADAKKGGSDFGVWCEFKELKREYRMLVFDGKIITISERIRINSVDEKEPDEKMNFVYIPQDKSKFPYYEEFDYIKSAIQKKIRLEFYCIDVMQDTNDKFWVPEINNSPGLSPNMACDLYLAYVPYAYGIQVAEDHRIELERMISDEARMIARHYSKEYNDSVCPIQYR